MIYKRTTCRCCLGKNLETVWRLGPTPLADAFLTQEELDGPEAFYPLDVNFCNDCGFLQLSHVVSADVLFNDYCYFSSTSPVFVQHFEEFARDYRPIPNFVLDIGSNDGILLKPFIERGVKALGVEPALNVAEEAIKNGIPTWPTFFNDETARKIKELEPKIDLITATNVFAHIDDLDSVIRNVKKLLSADGTFVVECQYLLDHLERVQLGLVYHEHLSYWSVRTLSTFFARHDMYISRVEEIDTHNGSIRVYVKKGKKESVSAPRGEEKLADIQTYLDFNAQMLENKVKLLSLLTELKNQGMKICAYGAAAKCMTPLNFFGIGLETLDFIVDDSPQKQGKYTPGRHLPVVPVELMYKATPDYVLITAWNFADAIMRKHPDFKYIIPVPDPKVI